MAYSDLSPADCKVYDYLRQNDFVAKPWSTAKAAKALKLKPAQVYESLSSIGYLLGAFEPVPWQQVLLALLALDALLLALLGWRYIDWFLGLFGGGTED